MERAQVYLNEDRYYEALGLGRREVDEKDARRFNRMAQGAEIKHNERMKNEYAGQLGKGSDKRQRAADGQYINPKNDIDIDDEYMDEATKAQRNKIKESDEIYEGSVANKRALRKNG